MGEKRKIPDRRNKMETAQRNDGDGQSTSVAEVSDPGQKGRIADVGNDRLGPNQENLYIIC